VQKKDLEVFIFEVFLYEKKPIYIPTSTPIRFIGVYKGQVLVPLETRFDENLFWR